MLVIQTGFIRKGNYKAHIALGIIGMFIALGVILSTFYVFVVGYKGLSVMEFYVKANRLFTLSFAVLVLLTFLNRKNGVLHKRYLYVGTLYVLGPILDRVAGKLNVESLLSIEMFEAIIWNALFLSLFIYDWLTLRKIHIISWVGFIWFYIVWILAITI